MVDRENQHIEQSSKALPSRPDQDSRKEQEQESFHDFHALHPTATPTRAQQQRHRRNLRLSGQVDVEKGSLPRHTFKEDRRDSWIDRINSSTKNAIRRTSMIAAVDEKKLIDKVADSINDYGDQHKEDSWTDKVMNFLFPSMGLENKNTNQPFDNQKTPAMTPSDDTYDQIQRNQHTDDRRSWSATTTDTSSKVDKSAMNQDPNAGLKPETSDQAYDDAQAICPDKQPVKSYADATQTGHHRSSSSSSTSSWSMFNENETKSSQLDLDNESQWPPL